MKTTLYLMPATTSEFNPMTFLSSVNAPSLNAHTGTVPAIAIETDDAPYEQWSNEDDCSTTMVHIDGQRYSALAIVSALQAGHIVGTIIDAEAAKKLGL